MSAALRALPRLSRFRVPRWYLLPMPVAILLVLLMPWAAVREQRRLVRSLTDICDILVAAHRRDQRAAAAAPPPRHLHLVQPDAAPLYPARHRKRSPRLALRAQEPPPPGGGSCTNQPSPG